jgi:hypothetical protein
MHNQDGVKEDILFLFYSIPATFFILFFFFDSFQFPDFFSSVNFLLLFSLIFFTYYASIFRSSNILTLENRQFITPKQGIKEDIFNFTIFNTLLIPCLYFYDFDYHFLYSNLGIIGIHFLFFSITFFLLALFFQKVFIELFSLKIFKGFMAINKIKFYFPEKSTYITYFYSLKHKRSYYINNKYYGEEEMKKDGYSKEHLYKLIHINKRFPLIIKELSKIKNKNSEFFHSLNNWFLLKSKEEISFENKEENYFFDQYQDQLYAAILKEDKETITHLIEQYVELPYKKNTRILAGAVYLACFTKNMEIIKYLAENDIVKRTLIYLNVLKDILIQEKLINSEILCIFLEYREYSPEGRLFDLLDLNNEEHFKALMRDDRKPRSYSFILDYIIDNGNLKQLHKALSYSKLESLDFLHFNLLSLYNEKKYDKLVILYNHPKLQKIKNNLEKEEKDNIEKFLMNNKIKHF